MTYTTTLTSSGRQKIAAAIASNQPFTVNRMALGDGNGDEVTPSGNETALKRERFRGALDSLLNDGENLVAYMIVPPNVGGWTLHEVGLYDPDGVLVAYGKTPAIEKPEMFSNAGIEFRIKVHVSFVDA